MEQSLINNQSNHNLEVSKGRIQEVGIQVYQINQVISFPMNDIQIEDMSKSILELCPEIEGQMLKNIVDNFKTGKYEWDKSKNIQNIFDYIPKEFYKLHIHFGVMGDEEKMMQYHRLYEKYQYITGQSSFKPDWMKEEENK